MPLSGDCISRGMSKAKASAVGEQAIHPRSCLCLCRLNSVESRARGHLAQARSAIALLQVGWESLEMGIDTGCLTRPRGCAFCPPLGGTEFPLLPRTAGESEHIYPFLGECLRHKRAHRYAELKKVEFRSRVPW